MTEFRRTVLAACAAAIAAVACRERAAPGAAAKRASDWNVSPKPTAESPPPPFRYPAPVKGHFREINVGEFDLVDGVAYPGRGGTGTVVYVTSKPIASPVVAGSPCPMTQARFLTELRDAGWSEVTLDARGRSNYFAAGRAFGGSTREQEVGGHYWSSQLSTKDGRAVGSVGHRQRGEFRFDLSLSSPRVNEVSEGERSQGRRSDETAPPPAEEAVTAAYRGVREAALRKDLKALLTAQGFGEKQVAAIRGLAGIDADLAVYADRFLTPGDAGDFTARPGTAYVRSEGTNSKGKKFANYYHFAPCGSALVLVRIAENPQ